MSSLIERMDRHPIVPYIRSSDFAVRKLWRYAERRLLDYLFIYVKEGILQVWVDGREYRFEAGQFCLVQPGSIVILEGATDTITPFAHFDIFYNPERANSFPTKAGQIDLSAYQHLMQPRLNDIYGLEIPVRIEVQQPKKLIETIIIMVELWRQYDASMQLKAHLLAYEIIVTILESYMRNTGGMRAEADPLKWIVAYFSTHLNEPLSVEKMASRANLSESRFSALFKRRYAVSPHRYLLHMRVDHAKELLVSSDLSQEEIANYCGFSDVHHFSKAFRRISGLTPGEWRRK
ncbi:AraC family transcriptional regulator [Cohnella silvisoli]|uniref:AraC family transcriptional regulator n=1 Tax=Cohnella silvisoli TaxID=2873699 RepID=A0ABV1KL80_9BACL|nr:AraC family transcriptional regulator [Cohnella silvisoli]MCD9020776.1 AraC family transcriptional regulator [Cohnella silvisoli]